MGYLILTAWYDLAAFKAAQILLRSVLAFYHLRLMGKFKSEGV